MHKSARTRSRENTGKAKALDAALASLTSTLGKRSQQLVTDAKKKRKLKSNAVGVPQARAEDVERAVARSPAFGGQASLSTSAETERPTTTATAAATQASVEGPVEVPASGEASSSSASSSASSTASSSAPAPAHAHAHYVDGAQVEPVLARLDRDMLVKFALAQQAALTQQSIVQFVQGEETAVKIAALEATVATLTRDLAIKMHAADAEIGHLKAQLMLACHERDELVLATLDVTNHESILSSQLQVASPDEQLTEDGAAPTTMATHAETEADADTLELPALPQHTVLDNFLPSDAVASPAMDDDCDDAGSPLALPSSPGDVAALDESDMRWIMTTLEPFDQDELPLA